MISPILYLPEFFGFSIEVYIICFIIAIAIFLISRLFLKRSIKNSRNRTILTWAITIVATPLIYISLIVILIFWISYTPSRSFDKSKWLSNQDQRFEMAGDLISSKMLMSKDTSEVKQILGSLSGRYDATSEAELQAYWIYDMGMGGGGLGFMFHNLIVKFHNNKVIAVEHRKIRD
jgi:hypothetical protein